MGVGKLKATSSLYYGISFWTVSENRLKLCCRPNFRPVEKLALAPGQSPVFHYQSHVFLPLVFHYPLIFLAF